MTVTWDFYLAKGWSWLNLKQCRFITSFIFEDYNEQAGSSLNQRSNYSRHRMINPSTVNISAEILIFKFLNFQDDAPTPCHLLGKKGPVWCGHWPFFLIWLWGEGWAGHAPLYRKNGVIQKTWVMSVLAPWRMSLLIDIQAWPYLPRRAKPDLWRINRADHRLSYFQCFEGTRALRWLIHSKS